VQKQIHNIVDDYQWTDHRKLLTPRESGVEALRCFGVNLRHQAGLPLQDHIHSGCMEIVFFLSGFQVYEASGSLFHLRGSDIFVTYPDEPHSSAGYLEDVNDMIWLQLDLSPSVSFFGLTEDRAALLRSALLALPRIFSGTDALRQMLQDSFYLLASPDPFSRLSGEQTLLCALFQLIQCSHLPPQQHSDRLSSAVSYIHEHIADPLTLEEISRFSGLSLSRFKCCFKSELGISPREYINQVKIRQACRLLEEGRSVTDTAMALGFTSSNYFSVLFKKFTCMTPSRYAELHFGRNCHEPNHS